MTKYERALQLWGADKLRKYLGGVLIDEDTVSVHLYFTEGYTCCGGSDPLCYCSFAESPRAEVVITGCGALNGYRYSMDIEAEAFDFGQMMREMSAVDVGVST